MKDRNLTLQSMSHKELVVTQQLSNSNELLDHVKTSFHSIAFLWIAAIGLSNKPLDVKIEISSIGITEGLCGVLSCSSRSPHDEVEMNTCGDEKYFTIFVLITSHVFLDVKVTRKCRMTVWRCKLPLRDLKSLIYALGLRMQ